MNDSCEDWLDLRHTFDKMCVIDILRIEWCICHGWSSYVSPNCIPTGAPYISVTFNIMGTIQLQSCTQQTKLSSKSVNCFFFFCNVANKQTHQHIGNYKAFALAEVIDNTKHSTIYNRAFTAVVSVGCFGDITREHALIQWPTSFLVTKV